MKSEIDLITCLANGESVSASPEYRQMLEALGLDLLESDLGMSLLQPLELLDEQVIKKEIVGKGLSSLEIHWTIDSTNSYLMNKAREADFSGSVCLAEQQSSGRGRRGKKWISPFGRNIYLSIAWKIPMATGVAGLSLVVGMQIAKSLQSVGLLGAGLKWPNDILLNGAKLAGILIELSPPEGGHINAVVGIGINLLMSKNAAQEIDQPWSHAGGLLNVSRNKLVSILISNLVAELDIFANVGFAPYRAAWDDFNLYGGQSVCVHVGDEVIAGSERGVDDVGNLLLETGDGLQTFNAGEVSLRSAK